MSAVKPYVKVEKIHTNNFKHATAEAAKLGFRVIPVATLEDNYAYIIVCPKSGAVAVVDPAEPDKVVAALKREAIDLTRVTHVLTTHHHWDHSQGNSGMVDTFGPMQAAAAAKLVVVGGTHDPVPAATLKVAQGDAFRIGTGLRVDVIHTPCHTRGHVLFHVRKVADVKAPAAAAAAGTGGSAPAAGAAAAAAVSASAVPAASDAPGALFTGDTLFTGGCGRFFEGVAKEMVTNLYEKLEGLADATQIWSGHEYTSSNLRFCVHCEPDNKSAAAKHAWALAQDNADDCTQPSTLAEERSYNAFMRVHLPHMQKLTGKSERVDVMDAVRTLKNNFK